MAHKLTETIGALEAAIQQAHVVRGRAIASINRLEELRWQALMELAKPQPGDRELGLLDGIDLRTMKWTEEIAEAKAERIPGGI